VLTIKPVTRLMYFWRVVDEVTSYNQQTRMPLFQVGSVNSLIRVRTGAYTYFWTVFLRVLEYYQGIMFLTTNQIAEFDIAIPSRIHVAIKYQSLNEDQMLSIFKGFLETLKKKDLIEDYQRIMEWLNEDVFQEGFDGRQIRNIVTTALGFARAEQKLRRGGGKLAQKHMKRAFNNVKRFKSDFQTQMERYKETQGKLIK
jgi:hypothetical protein